MGGKRDWKIVVVRVSRCFGKAASEPFGEGGEMKLFMTRRGGVRYSWRLLLGYFWALCTSLAREYLSTRKCRVGPRGVRAKRRFVLPVFDLEKRRRWDTPRGPAMVV